jgi:capsular exopolysaccharide synthesis family protein
MSSTTPRSLAPLSRNGHELSRRAPAAPLAMLAEPHSAAAEAYRTLAANVQFSGAGEQVRTIGITSAAGGEGKSTTVANLAIALAEGGRRVIVVDADLRRPELHELFGVANGEGLSSVLAGEALDLPLVDTAAPGVRLLASGPLPANALEVLASPRMEQVIGLASAQADFVLLDTAPAGVLADAAVVTPRLDGVLLVVSAGRTRRDLAQRARDQLQRVGANVLGVVLVDALVDNKLYRY